jgi:hypothetical protein
MASYQRRREIAAAWHLGPPVEEHKAHPGQPASSEPGVAGPEGPSARRWRASEGTWPIYRIDRARAFLAAVLSSLFSLSSFFISSK